MSVLKSKRSLSKMEFYHNARKLRKELTLLTLREFGIHSRGRKLKEGAGSEPEGFHDELIAEFSRNIRLLLRNLMYNLTAGNTIYPVNEAELVERRLYQDRAIVACEQLIQEVMYGLDMLPVKASVFMPYVSMIEFEVKLLKGWRKSNNKFGSIVTEKKDRRTEGL